jgi:hypothetical protein
VKDRAALPAAELDRNDAPITDAVIVELEQITGWG